MTITPLYAFASAPPLNVLIVPGGKGVDKALRDKAIANYLPLVIPKLKLVASISSGALLLGHYGLLRGKTVTTHPEVMSRLEDYEILRVSKDNVVYDDNVWTCSGSVSGIQLAFELCKGLFGDGITAKVADVLNVQTLQGQLF
jgi:transcriptional regulator GlxA family with amidase domain